MKKNNYNRLAGDQQNVAKSFTVNIKNTNADGEKRIALFSGILGTTDAIMSMAGAKVDYIAKDGADETAKININCGGRLGIIQSKSNYAPMEIVAMQIESKSTTQLSKAITLTSFDAISQSVLRKQFLPSDSRDSRNSTQNMVDVKTPGMYVGDNTVLDLAVLAGEEVNITFYVGRSFDAAEHVKATVTA